MIAPWAKEEVATADLGDERLDDRLVTAVVRLGKPAEPEHPRGLWRTGRNEGRLSLLRQ